MDKEQIGRKTALIYCRIGSNQTQDTLGFCQQEAACTEYALSHGYAIYRVTKEVSSAGQLQDRPLFSCDLAELHQHAFDAVIVYLPDRLSRNPVEVTLLAEDCKQTGVALLFAATLFDKADEGLLFQITDTLARHEYHSIRQRLG